MQELQDVASLLQIGWIRQPLTLNHLRALNPKPFSPRSLTLVTVLWITRVLMKSVYASLTFTKMKRLSNFKGQATG